MQHFNGERPHKGVILIKQRLHLLSPAHFAIIYYIRGHHPAMQRRVLNQPGSLREFQGNSCLISFPKDSQSLWN